MPDSSASLSVEIFFGKLQRKIRDKKAVRPFEMPKAKAAISWSGGKDSYLALHRVSEKFELVAALTMFTEDGARSRSHGLRPEVVERQAKLLEFPLLVGRASWKSYEEEFKRVLREVAQGGCTHVVFGDIFLDDHKLWVERVCGECALDSVEPLWGEDTEKLFREFVDTGATAQIVSAKAALLDNSWLGKRLSVDMLPRFRELGVDPCGERGEYHTVIVDSPLMTGPLGLRARESLQHDGYWLQDLELG